jgi:hypothetical protein
VAQNPDNAHIFCSLWLALRTCFVACGRKSHIFCGVWKAVSLYSFNSVSCVNMTCTAQHFLNPLHVEVYVKCRDKETIITNIRIRSYVNEGQ